MNYLFDVISGIITAAERINSCHGRSISCILIQRWQRYRYRKPAARRVYYGWKPTRRESISLCCIWVSCIDRFIFCLSICRYAAAGMIWIRLKWEKQRISSYTDVGAGPLLLFCQMMPFSAVYLTSVAPISFNFISYIQKSHFRIML